MLQLLVYNPPPTMSQIAIDPTELAQLVHLLELAHSSDNAAQHEVYQTLKTIEEQPRSYLYLAAVLANQSIPLPVRKMGGLTLGSFLKRNKNTVHFEPTEMEQIKAFLLRETHPELEKVRSMAISELISRSNFDFELLGGLIAGLQSHGENIGMVNIILEDIKFNNQNYNIFEDQRFWTLTEAIYQRLLALLQPRQGGFADGPHVKDSLKCINLLTFHCPPKLYHYLSAYLETVIKPILILSSSQALSLDLLQLCLDGANEIVATKFSLLSKEVVQLLIGYSPVAGWGELQKIWSNIMIQMIENENDLNNSFQQYLPAILPRAIQGLTFTHQDQRNIKQEMEVEYNPYGGQTQTIQQEQQEQAEILQASYGAASGYTLRKLSFQLIEKISIFYSDNLWNQWAQFIGERLRSEHPSVTETAISFIGIIAEACMHDMGGDLQQSVLFLLQCTSGQSCALVRATSLWALEKLLSAFKDEDQIVKQCLVAVLEGVCGAASQGTHTTHLMLKQASISLLDEILSLDSISRLVAPQDIDQIINALLHGLVIFKGRALFSVFKALSTIFESEYFRMTLPEATCDRMVGQLCRKWSTYIKSDSVMCPLLECLITAYEGLRKYLAKFNTDFFTQLIPLLRGTERKQLVLRCIDFLSALVSAAHPDLHPCIASNHFHDLLCSLATSEQKQIRHFAYILISDVAKAYNIGQRVDGLVLLVAQTMQGKSLTSSNNALMCLTDLIQRYPHLKSKYLTEVCGKVVDIVSTQELASVYAFNFARMLGRLWLLDCNEGRRQVLTRPSLMQFAFISLRTREVTKLTSDSFRGLLQVIDSLNSEELKLFSRDLECVLQALVCYPVRREESPENQAVISVFVHSVSQLRAKLGQAFWQQVLQRPIFLPAAIRTLNSWSNS